MLAGDEASRAIPRSINRIDMNSPVTRSKIPAGIGLFLVRSIRASVLASWTWYKTGVTQLVEPWLRNAERALTDPPQDVDESVLAERDVFADFVRTAKLCQQAFAFEMLGRFDTD